MIKIPPLRRLANSPATQVAAGTALGQVLLAASLPVVARLAPPAEVGLYGLLLAYTQVAAILSTGRSEQILPRLEAGHRFPVAIMVSRVAVLLAPLWSLLLVLLAVGTITVPLFAACAVATLSTALLNIATSSMLALQEFRVVAAIRVLNAGVTSLLLVASAWWAPWAAALIGAYAIGSLLATLPTISSLTYMRRAAAALPPDAPPREHLRPFVTSVGTGALLSNVSLALPLIGVSFLFGPVYAATFFLVRRLLMVPTQLVASTVSEVGYAVVARKPVTEVWPLVRAWMRRVRLPAVAVVALGIALSVPTSWVLGPGYPDVVLTMVLLSLPTGLQMAATAFTNILLAMRAERSLLLWNVGRVITLAAVFLVAWAMRLEYGPALAVYAVALLGVYLSLLVLVRLNSRQESEA